jgi:large subunit ribosomal protein L9
MIDARKEKLRAEAEQLQKGLDGVSVTIAKKAGDNTDRLFGSVTNRDIASALEAAGHKVDSKKILLENPIKELGIFGVPVKLHTNITASVKVWIVNA